MTGFIGAEIIARRVFDPLYIYLDTAFLVGLCAMLIVRRKYLTCLFGLFGGVLYFIVDYGIFHLALGTRSIEGGSMFGVLLWMSMSYGLTNFVWIWLWMSRDEHKFEWTLLIVVWWFCAPMLADTFGGKLPAIRIQRTTGSYHGAMALILLAGYFSAAIYNIFRADKTTRLPILWLLAIGISVQLGWELSLLLGGIRSADMDLEQKLTTLAVNSLLETNLGAVPLYCIYAFITSRVTEQLKPRAVKTTFTGRIAELNAIKLFGAHTKDPADAAAPQTHVQTAAADTDGDIQPAGENV